MIKLIEKNEEFDDFFKNDIFYIRIMSLLKAYSTNYNFALFYKQLDDNGNITSIISRLDNDYTVCHNHDFDLIEVMMNLHSHFLMITVLLCVQIKRWKK